MSKAVEKGVAAGLVAGDGNAPTGFVELWSRDGYVGTNNVGLRKGYTPTFTSVSGPHVPWRMLLSDFRTPDEADPAALPAPILTARDGTILSVSRLTRRMDFILRNVDFDEMHFLQFGSALFETDWGRVEAGPGDFVFVPKSVAYRVTPLQGPVTRLVLESPFSLGFDTPAPFGMIDFGRSVRRAQMPTVQGVPTQESTTLLVKSYDGVTRYEYPHDITLLVSRFTPQAPVFALNLRDINPVTYERVGGPPQHFFASPGKDILLYTLSSRRTSGRPPVHYNADFEEIIHYFDGPGAWGCINEPGTLTWVPKGVSHHGPSEDVPEGYLAFLLELRSTPRLTEYGKRFASVMAGTYEKFAGPVG
jgi:homogentisate 1,2-dioxygenase